jgi:hypothetical protein
MSCHLISSFLRDFVILSFCLDVIIRYDMQIILNHPCRRCFMFLFLRTLFCLCDFGLFLDSLSERRIWSPLFYFKFLQVSICKVFQGDQTFSGTVGNIVGRVKAGPSPYKRGILVPGSHPPMALKTTIHFRNIHVFQEGGTTLTNPNIKTTFSISIRVRTQTRRQ